MRINGPSRRPLIWRAGFFVVKDTMRNNTNAVCTSLCAWGLLGFVVLFAGAAAGGMLTIHSRTAVDLELVGYDGLHAISLAQEKMAAGGIHTIATSYNGLAVLVFAGGQRYPVIIDNGSLTLKIEDASRPPSFTGSKANENLYAQLNGKDQETDATADDLAQLMIQAKHLLDSSSSIHTTGELAAKNKEFHKFVQDHYEKLRHSDMIRRLVGQYFMMLEYVDYHVPGTPAADIKINYQQQVLDGVAGWMQTLKAHIPEHEILNYCLSLYYERSQVTLASVIAANFPGAAYCPGVERETWSIPGDLPVVGMSGNGDRQLHTIRGEKIVAFVSDDCPVSMVVTVIRARQLVDRKEGGQLIVIPLQPLSETHLAMNRMVSTGNMLFIDDEQWRKENLVRKIRLPLFMPLREDLSVPVRTSVK